MANRERSERIIRARLAKRHAAIKTPETGGAGGLIRGIAQAAKRPQKKHPRTASEAFKAQESPQAPAVVSPEP